MRSLEADMARVEAQLKFIPMRLLRQARLLALLNEHTGSTFSYTQRTDPLGRVIGGAPYPLTPWRLAIIPDLGPALNVLFIMTEVHERFWSYKPGAAFVATDDEFCASLVYEFICQPLDERHIAVVPFAHTAEGSQSLVMMTRGREHPPYGPRDLQTMETICARFAAEWEDVPAGGAYQPRAPRSAEHVTALDSELRPTAMPLYSQALLAVIYGRLPWDEAGRPQLPAELVASIHRQRQEAFAAYQTGAEDLHYAFTKSYRGRTLCLTVQSSLEGGYRLTCHEDASKHERLCRLKRVCWSELARDRHTVFHAALALLDGEREVDGIARRAGIVALKDSSKLRIINRARNIVAAL